jgi:TonB family protein
MIDIDIKYHYKNSVSDNKEDYRAYFSVSLIPEVEAQYQGGYQQLIKYLEENAISKISDTYIARREANSKYQQRIASLTASGGNAIDKIYDTYLWNSLSNSNQVKQGIVKFTVSEEGDIINAKITSTTGDAQIDKVLLDAIIKMPKWKPAENSKGFKVKQEFEFSVGNDGC